MQEAISLSAIQDERAIERLIAQYGHILDFGTPEEYVDLFAEDGVIEIQSAFINLFDKAGPLPYEKEGLASGAVKEGEALIWRGREALRAFVGGGHRTSRSLHVASQPLVTLSGSDSAEGTSYMRVYAQDYESEPRLVGFGRYLDRFRRTPTGWKIAHRICEVG